MPNVKIQISSEFLNSKGVRFIAAFFVLMIVSSLAFAAQDGKDTQKEELKNRIENLRAQIGNYQDEIYKMGQMEESIQNEVEILDRDTKKIELQIQETQLVIESLSIEISEKEGQIDAMEKEITAKEKILSQFMQEIYERGQASTIEIILGNQKFTDYFSVIDNLETYEDKTKDAYDQLVFLKAGLKSERNILVGKREEQYNLQMVQKDQEHSLEEERQLKDSMLSQASSEKQLLSQKMDKLQAELNMLQSLGEPIAIEEAVRAAKYASGLANVAPEFLLGVLRVESGLGTNVGGGRYKTDMNPAQWDTFKKICSELGIDPDKTPVSRRACYNSGSGDGCGGWGGAMGPAQFLPSTWMGYKSKVEKLTGEAPANPWDIKDSLAAMGLKLAAVDGVTSGNRKAWAKAAGMYLAGANWENYSWYSDRVLRYADEFRKMMNK